MQEQPNTKAEERSTDLLLHTAQLTSYLWRGGVYIQLASIITCIVSYVYLQNW